MQLNSQCVFLREADFSVVLAVTNWNIDSFNSFWFVYSLCTYGMSYVGVCAFMSLFFKHCTVDTTVCTSKLQTNNNSHNQHRLLRLSSNRFLNWACSILPSIVMIAWLVPTPCTQNPRLSPHKWKVYSRLFVLFVIFGDGICRRKLFKWKFKRNFK